MKRVTRNSVIAIAAASGAMAVAGPVYADAAADGSAGGSPGLLSGNGIQLPVHVPVNVCGNTANVVGLLNPAMGNRCANQGDHATGQGGSATAGQATAEGRTHGSPGVVSGNDIQVPVDLPVNLSGNSIDVVGIGNPVFGNTSANISHDRPDEPIRTTPHTPRPSTPTPPTRVTPPTHHRPPVTHPAPEPPRTVVPPRTPGTLAHTGADVPWTAAAAGLASVLGGTVLYRRFRTGPAGR